MRTFLDTPIHSDRNKPKIFWLSAKEVLRLKFVCGTCISSINVRLFAWNLRLSGPIFDCLGQQDNRLFRSLPIHVFNGNHNLFLYIYIILYRCCACFINLHSGGKSLGKLVLHFCPSVCLHCACWFLQDTCSISH
jgi:hypothetical protein